MHFSANFFSFVALSPKQPLSAEQNEFLSFLSITFHNILCYEEDPGFGSRWKHPMWTPNWWSLLLSCTVEIITRVIEAVIYNKIWILSNVLLSVCRTHWGQIYVWEEVSELWIGTIWARLCRNLWVLSCETCGINNDKKPQQQFDLPPIDFVNTDSWHFPGSTKG